MGLPGLGGLFADGMPTLKKSSDVATNVNSTSEDNNSRRESTDWFGRLASNTPVETPASQPEPTISSVTDVTPESTYPNTATILPPSSQATSQAQSPADLVEKVKNPIESKVDFSNGYRAKALWSYSAVDMEHVSFDAGSYMRVYPSKEAGNVDWVYGELEQDEQLKGWLPKAYTEQICGKFNVHPFTIALEFLGSNLWARYLVSRLSL
jgi:hypothetical protein